MNKNVSEFVVTDNIQLNYNNFLIKLQPSFIMEQIVPGQFVNILINDSKSTFLRRPFSIFDIDYKQNILSILVKIAGEGSKKLTGVKVGEKLDMIFPLGNGFTSAAENEQILLVGGGVGIAPLLFMARESRAAGAEVNILLGARSSIDHILLEEFAQYGPVHLTTDDGSLGTKGLIVQHEIFNNHHKFSRIYCCGPDPMMHAVAKKARILQVSCEVSLENMMACGFGVCLCCVTPTKQGNQCVCTDGPVFNIEQLKW